MCIKKVKIPVKNASGHHKMSRGARFPLLQRSQGETNIYIDTKVEFFNGRQGKVLTLLKTMHMDVNNIWKIKECSQICYEGELCKVVFNCIERFTSTCILGLWSCQLCVQALYHHNLKIWCKRSFSGIFLKNEKKLNDYLELDIFSFIDSMFYNLN